MLQVQTLTNEVYELAKGDATNCTGVANSINKLEEKPSLYIWLQNALKITDHLALHYLQNIINEVPTRQNDAGVERSRYIQINQRKNDAEKAGRILDKLYEWRNKLEHRYANVPNEPDKQKIIAPNYKEPKD